MRNDDEPKKIKKPVEIGLAGLIEQHLSRYIHADRDVLPSSGLYQRILDEVERPLLRLVLDVCQGNQIKASHVLGINRNTLHKKLKKHDLLTPKGRKR